MAIIGADHRSYPDAYWPPFFPIVLAVLIKLHSLAVVLWLGRHFRLVIWLRLAMSTINALSLAGLTLIAFRLLGRRTALVTTWIGALYLPWIDIGASLYSESLLIPLVIATCVATLEYRRTRRWFLLVSAGLLAGLAAMTHGNGLVLVPIVCAAVWRAGRLRTRPFEVRRLRSVLAVIAAAAVIAPWTVRNAVELHAFVPVATSLGNTLAGTYNSRSARSSPPARWLSASHRIEYRAIFRRFPISGPAEDAALERRALQYIEDHPQYLLTVGVWNTAHLLGFTLSRLLARGRPTSAFTRLVGLRPELGVLDPWCPGNHRGRHPAGMRGAALALGRPDPAVPNGRVGRRRQLALSPARRPVPDPAGGLRLRHCIAPSVAQPHSDIAARLRFSLAAQSYSRPMGVGLQTRAGPARDSR
jgi:hypothetical protein